MDHTPLIYCCSDANQDWQWLAPRLDPSYRWRFFSSDPRNFLEHKINKPSLKRIRTAWDMARAAQAENPDMIVIHGPSLGYYFGLSAQMLKLKTPAIIYSFNFPHLPTGIKKILMRHAFGYYDKIVVYSEFEKQLYSNWFDIPENKIDVLLWGVQPPELDSLSPPLDGKRYICTIGGNARDYKTLMAAMEKLPDVPLLAVVRPGNLKGIHVPPNVKVYENIPLKEALNILKHSEFLVLPLDSHEIPCGHVTIVNAMYLKKPFIITDSKGVADYVNPDFCLTCQADNPKDWVMKIQELWNDKTRLQYMGEQGYAFANTNCSEQNIVDHFESYIASLSK